MKTISSVINANATRLRDLKDRIKQAFARRPHGADHRAACDDFHAQYDQLAFPGGLERGLALLREKDPGTVETAIAFLETDPRFFRSGYIKEEMLSRLKHVALSDRQVQRLGLLVIRSVDGGGRREFRAYARLAGVLRTPAIAAAVSGRQNSKNPEIARRAQEVLHIVASRRGAEGN